MQSIKQFKTAQRNLIYLDESGFYHSWHRVYGLAKRGKRCIGKLDWHRRYRSNAIGALLNGKLFAVGLFDSTINGHVFEAWVKQCLLPELPPNSVIIMDNAAFHKRETTKTLIEEAGHEILWLPPYSPDLNPIEKKWAEIKNKRKKYQIDCIDTLFRLYGV